MMKGKKIKKSLAVLITDNLKKYYFLFLFAQIRRGLIIYICFLRGATKTLTEKMGECLQGTLFFQI